MVSRTTVGKGFAGVVRYQFAGQRDQPTDKRAEILGSSGVSTNSAAEMIADFNLGRAVNPKLNFAVWHTSLSFNPDDAARLDSTKMRAITESYLQKMGLDKTQYLIVRHHDRPDNQHVHIIANRVDNAGKTIDDGRNFYRSKVALKELIKEHDLTPIQGQRPALQHTGQLKGNDLARHEFRDALNMALRQETQRSQLLATLKEVGITAKEYFNKEGQATGISFEKDGYYFKGSELGRNLSLAGIDKQLAANERQQWLVITVPEVGVVRPSVGVVASIATGETTAISPVKGELIEVANIPTTHVIAGVGAANSAMMVPPSIAVVERSRATSPDTIAEEARSLAQVVVVHQREKTATAHLQAPARKADRTDKVAQMPEPNFEVIPVVKQRLTADEDQAKSTPMGRELLGEQDSSHAGKVQTDESGAGDKQPAVAVSISEQLVTLSQAVRSAVSADGIVPLPLLTTIAVVPQSTSLTAPAVAWQYGTILLKDGKVRTSEERMGAVRAALREAGAQVGNIVPPTPGQLAATLISYRFDPKMSALDKVTTVLNDVQASGNSTVREKVYNWKTSDKHSAAERVKWPERNGQFNQARILIQDVKRGVERAERVAAALKDVGAHVSAPTRTEDGLVTLHVYYHTYAPKINEINCVLDQSNNTPNIEVQESTQDNKARYVGAVGVDIREQELGKNLGISR